MSDECACAAIVCVFYSVLCYGVCVASSGWGISGAMKCVCPSIVVCVCVWKAVEKVEEEEGGGTEKSQCVCAAPPGKRRLAIKDATVCVMAMRDEMKRRKREREGQKEGAASACVL